MDDLFTGAWLKWGWAVAEAKALEEDIARFSNDLGADGIGRSRCEYQPKHHRFAVVVDTITVGFPDRWGLRLGNFVHNIRSCLDHIAWAAVERGQRPPRTLTEKQQAEVYFPICLTRDKFDKIIRSGNKLPGVRRADIACIRRYQPYHRPTQADRNVFAILDRLSRLDKHRTIQPVAGYPFGRALEVTHYRDCEIRRSSAGNVRDMVEVGAEVAYIYVRKTGPNPEMHVKSNLAVQPAIENRFHLNVWLEGTIVYTRKVLEQFASEPSDLIRSLNPPVPAQPLSRQ